MSRFHVVRQFGRTGWAISMTFEDKEDALYEARRLKRLGIQAAVIEADKAPTKFYGTWQRVLQAADGRLIYGSWKETFYWEYR